MIIPKNIEMVGIVDFPFKCPQLREYLYPAIWIEDWFFSKLISHHLPLAAPSLFTLHGLQTCPF